MRGTSAGWIAVIGLSFVSPAAILLSPFLIILALFLLPRFSGPAKPPKVDKVSGMTFWEHTIHNPGIPFRTR